MLNYPFDERVRCRRVASVALGPGESWTTLTELRDEGGVLEAFANDNDIQEMTVISTSIGFVRIYRKFYKDTVPLGEEHR